MVIANFGTPNQTIVGVGEDSRFRALRMMGHLGPYECHNIYEQDITEVVMSRHASSHEAKTK